MHWNVEQVLWALVLAGHLVLLIVLLGRDRAKSFPWFTAAIALSAVRLLADHLLHGKLTTVAFYWQSYGGMVLDGIVGILVLVELCRAVFASGDAGLVLKTRGWAGWSLVTVILAGGVVWWWGQPWPTMASLRAEPAEFPLFLTILVGIKMQIFVSLLTVEAGLLLRVFGGRFGFGWRSHAQQLALGLSTNALGVLAVQAIEDLIRHNAHYATLHERNQLAQHLGKVFSRLEDGRITVWLLILIWWIVWLWRDDPGRQPVTIVEELAEQAGPPMLEANLTHPGDESSVA